MDDGPDCRADREEEQLYGSQPCACRRRNRAHPADAVATGTFCGVFRRQALDRGAAQLGVDHIVTGHNADDIAETVLMNSELGSEAGRACRADAKHPSPVMRGDIARLSRCTALCTESEDTIKRSKPLKYAYEKEIVMCVLLQAWARIPS